MNDELRYTSQLTFDSYKNSVGSEIVVARVGRDVLMTAKEMARLYGVGRPTITRHLLKLYASRRLVRKSVSSVHAHRASDGKLYETRYYSLPAIIAVGVSLGKLEVDQFQRWLRR